MIPDEKAPAVAPSAGAAGASAPAIFATLLTVMLVSIGASALVLAGVGRAPAAEPAATLPVITAAPAATSRAAATEGAEGRVQVLSASGTAIPTGAGVYRVTFTWSLRGARENDPALVHFFVGNEFVGEQRGMLDASVFSFSTGTLTFVTEQECSASGWSAEIVTVRGEPVEGEGIATVLGVSCS